ncbi:MAG: DUF3373 family protein [Sulfurospirillum sp.]|nr:DUF3373 family protein [Sulfurospirillum sp.]
MKSFIAPLLVGATLATSLVADDSLKAEVEALKAQMAELKKAQESINISALQAQISEVKAQSASDNIKWNVDFRTAYDIMEHKLTSGMGMIANPTTYPAPTYTTSAGVASQTKKNSIWTNKLILGMAAQPVDNLVFKGSLGFYKAFGQSSIGNYSMFQDFDWYGTQKPQGDANIRLREAYFLYFGQMGEVPYTASFGRRPSVDGFMTNLRADNAYPASPVGHNINMEFDGASFKFDLDKVTGISGFYAKLCLGRGFSDTAGAYSFDFSSAYGSGYENPDMDLAGLLIQAYDDGQYKVMANVFQGWNMMGMGMALSMNTATGALSMQPTGFVDVGDMQGASLSLQVNGIGNEINDFLDDTIAFASVAMSKTQPNNRAANDMSSIDFTNAAVQAVAGGYAAQLGLSFPELLSLMSGTGMLGSQDEETGYSYYVGVNMPGFMENDRIGIEYNHGSEYWRSFTYGEDTLAGSKLATRGDAYEIYYNIPLVSKNLTAQIRYTYMDYDYAGSDMFFGQTGNPAGLMNMMPYVESASNIHLSMRYRY